MIKTSLTLLSLISSALLTYAEKPLNFVLINIDDMGCRDLACFGSTFYETPHLDAFAQRALKCDQAYAACAVCSPSRASIMTGRYPTRLGITNFISYMEVSKKIKNGTPLNTQKGKFSQGSKKKLSCPLNVEELPLAEITIPEMLKPAGYISAHIGKWHLGHRGHFPQDQGFDVNFAGCGLGAPGSYFSPYSSKSRPTPAHLKLKEKGEYLTDRETEEAIDFISTNQNKPFFLYLSHYAVHSPNMGKPELVAKYKNKNATGPQKNAVYAAMVESVDQNFGKLFQHLENLNLLDRTVIIFTSDNGGQSATKQSPIRGKKGMPYEGGIRVPQLIYWPGLTKPGSTTDTPINHIDIFPTIAEAAGITPGHPIDGESLIPMLRDGTPLQREALFWHFPHYHASPPYTVVRSGNFKLIHYYEKGNSELYDLSKDPYEKSNISTQLPEKTQALKKLMHNHLNELDGQIPRPYQP
ncbi:sulfatase [Rubritalea tangerina]|uniref:Sulfatase n=1 Tax=Rubritalea tangerina TaxID=430798 RepID=A0ABW4ZAM7_9BACT